MDVLSTEQRRQWQTDGYLHLEGVLDEDQVSFFSDEIDRIRTVPGWEPKHDPELPIGHYAWLDHATDLDPGGFMDRGERVEDAAIRETWEEVNLEVTIDRLLNVYSYTGYPVVVVVYLVRVVGGQLRAMDETLEAATFAPAEIPWDELAFDSTRDALREYMALADA